MGQNLSCWQCLIALLVLFGRGTVQASPQTPKIQFMAIEPKAGTSSPGTRIKVYGKNFSTDTIVYLGGLEARDVKFIDPNTIEAVTPYARPGTHQLQLKSGEYSIRSDVTFTVLASKVDSDIDRALALAAEGHPSQAIAILTMIANGDHDAQVQAFAHYEIGQIYFAQGDLWRWAGEAARVFEPEAGTAAQTSWRYRLSYAKSVYFLPLGSDANAPLESLNWAVIYDITEDPEPRFFRAVVNARYGNLEQAKADSEFALAREANNHSYRALAAYIAALKGNNEPLQSFIGQDIADPRALSLLGEAAYLSGDALRARSWWSQASRIDATQAALAYWAGKKHLSLGHQRIAVALLNECIAMAPDRKEAKEAQELLANM